MTETVQINNSSENSQNNRWIPFSEGSVFLEFIKKKKEDFGLNDESIKEITHSSQEILSKCINPSNPLESGNQESTGLVIGEIQSGKTLSMTSVSAMAKDNGFGIIIVMSGNVTPLASQTAERIMGELEGRKWIKIINNPSEQWRSEHYLNEVKNFANSFNDTSISKDRKRSLLIVTFKNPARINQLASLFLETKDRIKNIPTLIIDDEADHHSLNTKDYLNDIDSISESTRQKQSEIYRVVEGDTIESICEKYGLNDEEFRYINDLSENQILVPGDYVLKNEIQTATHKVIKNLRAQFSKHSYLGYTATPNALTLIDATNLLSPSFTHILKSGKDYVGLNFFFKNNSNSKHIYNIEDNDVYNDLTTDNIVPPSLVEAVKIFILSVACGYLSGESEDNFKNRSMIIHPHNEVSHHGRFFGYVKNIIDPLKNAFKNQDDISFIEVKNDLKNVYDKYKKQLETQLPPFDDIFLSHIKTSLEEIQIIEFNARESRIPRIIWKDVYARILIGGIGLDRGYTINGLTVSYLSRSLGSKQDDTILQRARFFGYHKPYSEYIAIYLNSHLQNFYQEVCEINSNLMKSIKEHEQKGLSFKDWPRHWFGTNAAQHQLTRRTLIRYNLNSFTSKYPFKNKYSHKLSKEMLNENRVLLERLFNRLSGKMFSLNQLEKLLPKHKKWIKSKPNIILANDITIEELYKEYFSKINFHSDELTRFQAVNCNLSAFANNNSFKKRICPIIFMNLHNLDTDNKEKFRSETESGTINTHAGRSKSDPGGFPGDQYIHYDYLVGNTENQVGEENLTLQVYSFQKIFIKEGNNIIERPNIPFFNFYPAIKMWKDFIGGSRN